MLKISIVGVARNWGCYNCL